MSEVRLLAIKRRTATQTYHQVKGGNAMHRRLSVLLAVALMLASSDMASAAALANGKGGEMASPSAAFGIATAIANTMKHR